MKTKLVTVFLVIVLLIVGAAAFVFVPGCEYYDRTGIVASPPPQKKPVWTVVNSTHNPGKPGIDQEGGDVILEGLGEVIGFYPIAGEDRQILAVDWSKGILGFYTVDLHTHSVRNMGGIRLQGKPPKLETFVWPWILLNGEDDDGNRSWLLVDVSSGKAEVAWSSYAWVPQGLRRRPVWFSGQDWYLGPVSGPAVTDALSGETIAGKPKYEIVNPVTENWPRWAGGVSYSNWYLYPVRGGGSALVDLATGRERLLDLDQELVWNMERTLLAWTQDGELGLLNPRSGPTTLVSSGIVPSAPLWSSNGDSLYYLGGEDNYFGTTWKSLWTWEEETGVQRLFSLPGNWNRWRLLAATEEAVLAAAGDNGEHLIYFDVANEKYHELNSVQQWLWREGTLVFLREGDMLRLSPGFETKVLVREAEDITLLALVNQFVIYASEGKIFVKQLVM